jgi:hypothetical protein
MSLCMCVKNNVTSASLQFELMRDRLLDSLHAHYLQSSVTDNVVIG